MLLCYYIYTTYEIGIVYRAVKYRYFLFDCTSFLYSKFAIINTKTSHLLLFNRCSIPIGIENIIIFYVILRLQRKSYKINCTTITIY